jgi:methylated-DNA-[protein]-cysteine S-methyltransferase
MIQYKHMQSPLGGILIAANDQGLCGLWFDQQRHHPDTKGWQLVASQTWLDLTAEQIQAYFAGTLHEFNIPLSAAWGTGFQQSVWQALQQIPIGSTLSYGELAKIVNKPNAVRAVGAAVGKNPWSIVVPCHRIIGANGSLTGYAGGLDRKKQLLEWESQRQRFKA